VSNLRKLAKGQPCMIRAVGVCNFDSATTVLCHVRLVGLSGIGMKIDDEFGAWGCSNCHDWVDGRSGRAGKDERRLVLLEGMLRTQHALKQLGKL
jgi:hypothetical protein